MAGEKASGYTVCAGDKRTDTNHLLIPGEFGRSGPDDLLMRVARFRQEGMMSQRGSLSRRTGSLAGCRP